MKKYRVPYLFWTGICLIGAIPAYRLCYVLQKGAALWIAVLLDIGFAGFALIYLVTQLFAERRYPKLNLPWVGVWVFMMLWMIFSRSEYTWPIQYFLVFGALMLTDFSQEERKDMAEGILNGFLLAFFCIQCWSFLYRPFDTERYQGAYTNANVALMFYLEILAVTCAKLVKTYRTKSHLLWKVFYYLGVGTILAFIFMTAGRWGWFVALLMLLITAIVISVLAKRKMVIRSGLLMLLCTIVTIPICYCLVRYIPPLRHHPVWLDGEYSEEKVHSWDPIDSEKYTSFEEMLKTTLGRMSGLFVDLMGGAANVQASYLEPEVIAAREAEANMPEFDLWSLSYPGVTREYILHMEEDYYISYGGIDPLALQICEEGDPRLYPVLIFRDSLDNLLTREVIYLYYFRHLNLWGHTYPEQGFLVSYGFWARHAHDLYLQFGTDFGIPVMFCLIILLGWAFVRLYKILRKHYREYAELPLAGILLLIVTSVYGLFENTWSMGSVAISILFVIWSLLLRKDPSESLEENL